MHELAIAQRLLETVCEALPDNMQAKVTTLHIQLGQLAGLSKDELIFGFGVVAAATPLADARLVIEEIPALIRCTHCGRESQLAVDAHCACPICQQSAVQIIQGKELLLKAIEVADEGHAAPVG